MHELSWASIVCRFICMAPGRLMKSDCWILLVKYSYFEKGCRKKSARNNPERQYGIWSIHCFWHCSCRTYFCCFALALGSIVHGLSCHSFKISMKNSDLKTTHNTSRDCRVHFFRQPFSKYLYIKPFGQRFAFLSPFFFYNRESLRHIFITYVENSDKVNPTTV